VLIVFATPRLKRASDKYSAFKGPSLPDRTWPSKKITKPPRWLSTDLRDGNQALSSPMVSDTKEVEGTF
jgi:2-isopropylmalate synthase